MRWGEGPVWFADAQFLLFVDIPRSQILRWIALPRTTRTATPVTNLAFGGSKRNSPFVTAGGTLYGLFTGTRGVLRP